MNQKRSNHSFILSIESRGDSSVGIQGARYDIDTNFPQMDDETREDTREIFEQAVEKLADFPIRFANFEDECFECNNRMNFDKETKKYICENKRCLSNAPEF